VLKTDLSIVRLHFNQTSMCLGLARQRTPPDVTVHKQSSSSTCTAQWPKSQTKSQL
jgi:hypothetical protein